MIEWRFPSNDYGENKGINDSGVSEFKGTPLKSLAREICQNSLDACVDDSKSVVIDFSVFNIDTEKLPGAIVLKDTFKKCMKFWEGQRAQATKEFFTQAIEEIEKPSCTFLRISDFNTSGLLGSREMINTDWTNLTKSSGASDKRGTAGGSFGIGKFAPFACSAFSTVFYSTYDIKEEKASQGVSRLVTFTRDDGQNTQGVGYYGEERNIPIYDEMKLDPSFSRKSKEFGTDIYIPGYRFGGGNWQKDIAVSILESFLGAIWKGRLEVHVGNNVISRDTLGDVIELYKDDLEGYTGAYYKVLTSERSVWYEENFMGKGLIKLGLLLGEQDAPNRVSMIRKTGMKIMDKDRLPSHIPVIGVMFIEGDEINEQLRVMENPKHTMWEPERAKNPFQAREFIKSLNRFIKQKIEELVSTGAEESVDAVGVGCYLPDESEDSKDESVKENVSNRIFNIEIKEVKRKPKNDVSNVLNEDIDNDADEKGEGHTELGGNEEDWIHRGEKQHSPIDPRGKDDAHVEEGGKELHKKKVGVDLNKFISICTEKTKGIYVLVVEPKEDVENGVLEVFLSAETKKYKAPIKVATVMPRGSLVVQDNKITGLTLKKSIQTRIKVDLDYYDYCSMEVALYADKK